MGVTKLVSLISIFSAHSCMFVRKSGHKRANALKVLGYVVVYVCCTFYLQMIDFSSIRARLSCWEFHFIVQGTDLW